MGLSDVGEGEITTEIGGVTSGADAARGRQCC